MLCPRAYRRSMRVAVLGPLVVTATTPPRRGAGRANGCCSASWRAAARVGPRGPAGRVLRTGRRRPLRATSAGCAPRSNRASRTARAGSTCCAAGPGTRWPSPAATSTCSAFHRPRGPGHARAGSGMRTRPSGCSHRPRALAWGAVRRLAGRALRRGGAAPAHRDPRRGRGRPRVARQRPRAGPRRRAALVGAARRRSRRRPRRPTTATEPAPRRPRTADPTPPGRRRARHRRVAAARACAGRPVMLLAASSRRSWRVRAPGCRPRRRAGRTGDPDADADRLAALSRTQPQLDVAVLLAAQAFRLADTPRLPRCPAAVLDGHERVERAVSFYGVPQDAVLSGGRTLTFGVGVSSWAGRSGPRRCRARSLPIPGPWDCDRRGALAGRGPWSSAPGSVATAPWIRRVSTLDGSSRLLRGRRGRRSPGRRRRQPRRAAVLPPRGAARRRRPATPPAGSLSTSTSPTGPSATPGWAGVVRASLPGWAPTSPRTPGLRPVGRQPATPTRDAGPGRGGRGRYRSRDPRPHGQRRVPGLSTGRPAVGRRQDHPVRPGGTMVQCWIQCPPCTTSPSHPTGTGP